MTDIAEALGASGPLARSLAGFQPRDEQLRMAAAVGEALQSQGTLVVEAGTGTGKTFAYLVPALLSGQKVLVSTGTRNLQDQLFHKDLPLVRAALDRPVSVALLKGRANYLCIQRMEQARHTGRFDAPERAQELHTIERWSGSTSSGDVAEVEDVPEDSSIWPWVTSTTENCLGGKCPHYDDCHVLKARRNAMDADVVVINHHLLFADLVLKESGFGELLPGADAVIVDEAHQIAETAGNFFGTVVTARTIADLVRDATAAFVNDASDTPDLKDAADGLDTALKHLRLALLESTTDGARPRKSGPMAAMAAGTEQPDGARQRKSGPMAAMAAGTEQPDGARQRKSGPMAAMAAGTEQPDGARQRKSGPMAAIAAGTEQPDGARQRKSGPMAAMAAGTRLPWDRWPEIATVESRLDDTDAALTRLVTVLDALAKRAVSLEQCLERAVTLKSDLALVRGESEIDEVRWIEVFRNSFALHRTPLDVSGPLSQLFSEPQRSWIFTSATLAVGERFDHFTGALGLVEPELLQLGSPFDYEHNALLYVPEDLPEPNTPGFTRAVLDAALPVIAAAGGRTFMLFTSHRALRQAADELEGRFAFPLLVQGSAPRDALLREFRDLGNAVLLGTGSFWEGVDVRGPALSVVVIDKLPFAAPDDPVLAARIEAINASGGRAFMEYQLPRAVISLKQGVGRLIRDADDTGVMVICDTRLATKGYRNAFLRSLPPMQRTRDREEVLSFISRRLA